MAVNLPSHLFTHNLPLSSSCHQLNPSPFPWTLQTFFTPKRNPSPIPKSSLTPSQTPPPSNPTSSSSSSRNSIWVNPKASQLRRNSYDTRYDNLIKISHSLNSCNPTKEDVFQVLKDLGGGNAVELEHDAVVILNHMNNPETASLALNFFQKKMKSNTQLVLYNVTMKVFKKSNSFDKAESLLEEMLKRGVKPNNITFTTIIGCARRSNLPNKAVEIFEKMSRFGCKPNNLTYSAMVHAYGRAGDVDSALNVYEEIKAQGSKPNLAMYNALLDAIGKSERPWQVTPIYLELLENELEPNSVTYAALLRAYCRLRYWEDALFVYRETKEKCIELNVVLYNAMLAMCADTGLVDESLEIFDDMKSSGVKPDSWTFSSLIKVFSCNGEVIAAQNMLKEMSEAGFEPTIFVLTSLVQCYGKAKQADDVVKTFDQLQELGITPDDRFWGCFLNAMTHVGKEELGKLAGCMAKSNQMLGDVVTLLMDVETVDGVFKEKAYELFLTINEIVRRTFCNCFIDLSVNLNLLERACILLDIGLTVGIYSAVQSKSQEQWSLQLEKLSPGAAITAFNVWTIHLTKAVEQGEELPPSLGVNVGHGNHMYSDKGVAIVLESHFSDLNAPFRKIRDKEGWFLATRAAAKSWLVSSKSPEFVTAETLYSLLVHFM